ncbi:isoprenylcysteine carboxylmethyltransferase family protein [Sphingomonas sp. TREG-RG-20F-R18-01]|uniref:methyltransferase family protein n=1 Tax=Sphingomonas sp. TREG-RG-20F-R18-01 TaxID=2914982 RepID=UPI001F573BCD|nr:isoprenylcysteine carboxylmethyltransferase family protein [Sphingomonas sp. TREG-RG-20F-R18-01]
MPFAPEPVGLPGLAALSLGMAGFVGVLLLARLRGRRAPSVADSGRRNASIVWIVVQGVGIACAGVGPIVVTRDPLSAPALLSGAIVLMLMVAASALFDSASRTMGRNWALVARTRGDGTLVETGPFAYVRNPIYVALLLILLALAIACGHLGSLVIALPVFAVGTAMRIRHEETVLRAAFGGAYDRYAARVKRFLPGVF